MAFITGASGLLGAHLTLHLLQQNEEVFALKRSSTDLTELKKLLKVQANGDINLFDKIHWIEGDILDFYTLDKLVSQHKEVYHTAAFVSFRKEDHALMMKVNVEGTIQIAESCKNHKARLIYVSSIAALGRGQQAGLTTENDFREQSMKSSVYSKSKWLAEQEVWRAFAEGLEGVIVNPSVIIGPCDWNKSSGQLFRTVNNGLKYYTNGCNGYVDVRDVATIMFKLMKRDINHQRFIISAENVSYQKLFSLIAKSLGKNPPPYLATKWMSELIWRLIKVYSILSGQPALITKETAKSANSSFRYSADKIINELNYDFIPIEESIRYTATAFLKP